MLFALEEYFDSVGNHVRAFSTWRTGTGSSNISPSTSFSKAVKRAVHSFRTCMPTVGDDRLRISQWSLR